MTEEENESVLLEKAEAEEKGYYWVEATKLYDNVAKSFLDKEMVEKAAYAFKKLGFTNARAADTVDTSEEYKIHIKSAIESYKEAKNIFKQIKNKAEELECEAEINFYKGIIADSKEEGKKVTNRSYELFIESSEIFSNLDDQEGFSRTLSRAVWSCYYGINYCKERTEIENIYEKGERAGEKAWNISKKIGNLQILAESLQALSFLGFAKIFIENFTGDTKSKKTFKQLFSIANISLKLIQDCNDPRINGIIYQNAGMVKASFAVYFIEDIKDALEQEKMGDKGIELMEKGLNFIKKTRNKYLISYFIWSLNNLAIQLRRFKYVQKRLSQDLHDLKESAKIYKDFYNDGYFFSNFLPALYYTNLAQRSFFKPTQQEKYAKLAIQHAKESLEAFSFIPHYAWSYQALTWSYSQLANLAESVEEREKYAEKMLNYAKKANDIAKNYEGGFVLAGGYSSLYKAYKTLSDISKIVEDKEKMLALAIDAHKNYIGNVIESPTGIISAQMRLGFLYQELGILTGKIDALEQAKEVFLIIVKESNKRGFHYYTAAAYEYLAHVEDRLGNHMISSKHYEEAREAYQKSLKKIEFKELKNKITEKIDYVNAWNLIEEAKSYHKRENHLKAKECYKKAYDILITLPSFKYEAPYFNAWISQEEAENLTKEEKYDEAIKSYEKAKDLFENAIMIIRFFRKNVKRSKEIENLEKVAKIRMNHCSARIILEEARILGKKGEHIVAAEKFALAASQFRDVCLLFKLKRERDELKAVYYLCRAWESMELAENYEDPEKFTEAANLFTKASKLFMDSKMKLLASGNSAFCQALEHGSIFDKEPEIKIKEKLYPKIRSMLRIAASSYRKGGFKGGAEWALAASTYFDGVWNLIRADEELELDKRKEFLEIGSMYLKSAAELFGKNNYKDKEKEILERLDMVKKEEKILMSALSTIRKPSISGSTKGIIAPSCPLETSLAPKISEARRFTEEAEGIVVDKVYKKKYELIYKDLLKDYPRMERRECKIGVAQIGLSNKGDILSEFFEEKASGLLSLREDKVIIMQTKIKNLINKAHENGVNILLFPEMTIDLNYDQLLEDISNLAKTYEMIIIPGSYHDQKTKRNICTVFGPEGILWQQEKHIPAIINLEGKRFREGIETSSLPRKTIICNTEFGRIAIAICRDFLDMDLRVELKNFEPPIDIILNPAFTPVTADFKAVHFDGRRSIYAYSFFANVAEFGNSLIYTPEKERVERIIPPKKEDLIYKDVDIFKLRSERKKWEKEQNKERRFIQSTR